MTREELIELDMKEVQKIANDIGVPAKSIKRATKLEIVDKILETMAANPENEADGEEETDEGDDDDYVDNRSEAQKNADMNALVEQVARNPKPPIYATQGAPIPPLPPASKTDPTPKEIRQAVAHLVKRGLHIVKLDNQPHADGHHQWHFRFGTREAAGTVFQPLRTIVQQATMLMAPTKAPTEK